MLTGSHHINFRVEGHSLGTDPGHFCNYFRSGGRLKSMAFPILPPYLIRHGAEKRCSVCGAVFGKYVKPTISRAFREHVEKEHRRTQNDSAKLIAPGNDHKVK